MWSATVTAANPSVYIPDKRASPRQFVLSLAVRRSAIVSNLINSASSLPLPPVLGPVDALRAVLAVVRGHVQLLLLGQRLRLHPRRLVHRPLPDGLPRRALADRRQDGASVDGRVAGAGTKSDQNARWLRPPAWHHRKALGVFRRERRRAHQKLTNTRLHGEH